jgi:hypothetical protein
VNGLIKDWGCGCFLLWSDQRGESNNRVSSLFGQIEPRLRTALQEKTLDDREALILEELSQAMKEMGGTYVLQVMDEADRGALNPLASRQTTSGRQAKPEFQENRLCLKAERSAREAGPKAEK